MRGVGSQVAARQMMNDWTRQADPRHLILCQTPAEPKHRMQNDNSNESKLSIEQSPNTLVLPGAHRDAVFSCALAGRMKTHSM